MWQEIKSVDDLGEVIKLSDSYPLVLFKHSRRCMISSMAKRRLEKEPLEHVDYILVDVIASRGVSDAISSTFQVKHESPQLFVLSNGQVKAHTSHSGVSSAFVSDVMADLQSQD